MNKIEELIQQLCPEGVEWKMLGDISKINTGQKPVEIFEVRKSGIPYINAGLEPSGSVNTTNTTAQTITIPSRGQGGAGYVGYQLQDFWCGPLCYKIKSNKSYINTKFMFYYLKTIQDNIIGLRKIGSIPAVNKVDLEKISIPIPPLPIQQKIVSILDKFSQLEAELEAELEARRAQYNYYRNQLLSFEGKDVVWKMLGEIGEFKRGKRFVKDDIVAEGVPCIHYGEMYTHYHISATKTKSFLNSALAAKLRVAKTGDVIIVAAGETVEDLGKGVAWLGESDVVIHDACFAFKHKLYPKYVSHFLQTELFRSQIKRNVSSGKISAINASGLSKATIPIPSPAEQERIAGILDKFDALVNDLSVGLPAEIAARRKQYEFYRGKLLSFKMISD